MTLLDRLRKKSALVASQSNDVPLGTIARTIMYGVNKSCMPLDQQQISGSMPVRSLRVPEVTADACAWPGYEGVGYATS